MDRFVRSTKTVSNLLRSRINTPTPTRTGATADKAINWNINIFRKERIRDCIDIFS